MNIKTVCLVNFVSIASIHGMNLPLSLANLEKTLTQVTKFLVTKEPEQTPSIKKKFDLRKELIQLDQDFTAKKKKATIPINLKILQFDYHSQALQLILEYLNTQFEKLNKMPLESAQFDPSEQPKNEVAQNTFTEIASILTITKQLMQNVESANKTLVDIGDNFKKAPFNQNQKQNFISILTKENTKIIKNILQNSQSILQRLQLLPGNKPWGVLFTLKGMIDSLNCVLQYNEITLLRIKELVEKNDQKSIENDIESINELQSDTEDIYNQILSSLTKIKTSSLSKQEILTAINDLISIDTDPVFELACLINCIKVYTHFIKDTNLISKLSKSIAAISSKNFSEKLPEIKTKIPVLKQKMEFIKLYFENLDASATNF